jgi:predicted DCC family thiol-disulfide oxidoreductase YuxK
LQYTILYDIFLAKILEYVIIKITKLYGGSIWLMKKFFYKIYHGVRDVVYASVSALQKYWNSKTASVS